jgi:RNA polymerase sigma-B factor
MALQLHACIPAERDRSADDFPALLSRCKTGDARARETVILRFLPYARHLARRYAGRGQPLDDLYQAASVGLIRAVDKYEPERGDSFVAFATPTIIGEIRRHFRESAWCVRVPRTLQDRARRVAKVEEELRAKSARPPTMELIANQLGVDPGEVVEARAALKAYWPASLDTAQEAEDGEPRALGNTLGKVDAEYERVETRIGLVAELPRLRPDERKAVLLRFGGEHTQSEIAGRLGVSQMQVSRLLRHACATMAAALQLSA